MVYVADANFLLRTIDRAHPHYAFTRTAFTSIKGAGDEIKIAPQSLFEFYAVATRPTMARGGFGLSVQDAATKIRAFQRIFDTIPEVPLLPRWIQLVTSYNTTGLTSHDARLAAAVLETGHTHLLTFNTSDFSRYAPEGLVAVDPRSF